MRDDPDRKRRLRVLEDRAPFEPHIEHLANETDGALECLHEEQVATGLGLAAWHDELAVSVDLPPWQAERVELQCYTLSENDDGDVGEETTVVAVRNASGLIHLEVHDDWLRRADRDVPRTPDELWLNRAQWYPNVGFTPGVERQIRGMLAGSPALRRIAERLSALQDSLVDWNGVDRPDWRINVVPENEGRHQYCVFEDLDGERRLFELHVRYPPGPNRIHFRLDAAENRIVVAHVGRKLGI